MGSLNLVEKQKSRIRNHKETYVKYGLTHLDLVYLMRLDESGNVGYLKLLFLPKI